MIFDLGAVLSALITAGLAAAATLATAGDPGSRRIKRLERLVDLQERVDEPAAAHRLDYAIKSLSYQVAEDAKHLGNRLRVRLIGAGTLTMSGGIFLLVYLIATKHAQFDLMVWMGLAFFAIGLCAVMYATFKIPEVVETQVKKDLSSPPPAPPAAPDLPAGTPPQ